MANKLAIGGVLLVGCLLAVGMAARDGGKVAPRGEVMAHGARGDGTADDTMAVQRAVDSGAGVVRFGRGTYRLSRTVVIDLDRVGFTSLVGDGVARVVMAGPGPAFRFVGTHEGTAGPRSFKDNVWRNQRAPCVDGLEIVGGHPQACGIEATGTMQLTLSRLVVRKALHAIHLTKRNRNVLIDGCHLYENHGVGIYYDDVNLHQSNIIGCHISYNAGGGIVSRKGDVRNIHITGCDIEDNVSASGPETANVLLDGRDSRNGTGEVAITGCTLQHGRQAKGSANIRVIGRTQPSKEMPLVRQGHVTITGNVLSDVQVNVHLQDCRGVTLTGNTFWEGYTHNLLVERCHSIVVGANNMDRNPHYDRYGKAREASNGVVFRDCEDCTLMGLHLTRVRGGPGLLLKGCQRMNITGCTVLDCARGGVVLEGTSTSRLSDCLIRADGIDKPGLSLVVEGGKGNVVLNNVLGNGSRLARGAAHAAGNHEGR